MARKTPPRHEFGMHFGGEHYLAQYAVESGTVQVFWLDRNAREWTLTRVIKGDTVSEARSLLLEILTAAKERGDL